MKLELNKENTFCISLDSRWPAMDARLQRRGIPCTRWEACLPSELDDNFAEHLNPLQRACAQSHARLWQEMLGKNLDYAFIMEDDVLFHRDWREMLESWHVDDPKWDLLLLNASEHVEPEDTWVTCTNQWLTGGYIISKKGAQQLLANFQIKDVSDFMTCFLQLQGHSYTRFPWLVIQEGKDSTIGSFVEADHAKVLELLGKERILLYN
jgi:GR25 family glycosyltransferase involved in LPS biosynthesis